MKILVVSDLHGDIEGVLPLLDKVKEFDFDLIICPGDLTDIVIPKGFESEDIARILIEEFRILKKPLLIVPGNMDAKILEVLEKEKVNLHENGIKFDKYGFYGFGGARTPFGTPLEPSEEEIEAGLEKGFKKVEDSIYKIQVTHMPPYNTKIDIISSGAHVGSEIVRKFIEEKKPVVAISAHIHEAKGIDKLNESLLVNSGKFCEGCCAILDIEDGKTSGKIVSLM